MTMKQKAAGVVSTLAEMVVAKQPKPNSVVLTGPTLPTLHKMASLVRKGYIPTHLDVFGPTGQCSIYLEIGCPDPAFVEAAEAELVEALEREEHQKGKAIEEAAARLVAERDRAAARAAINAQIAEQEAALAALKAAAGAN